jgi:hypothetical protein
MAKEVRGRGKKGDLGLRHGSNVVQDFNLYVTY